MLVTEVNGELPHPHSLPTYFQLNLVTIFGREFGLVYVLLYLNKDVLNPSYLPSLNYLKPLMETNICGADNA